MVTALSKELQPIENFKYDLLFILTPTASLNYEATGKFVDHLQANIKERIKLVICLDALTDSSSLTHHLYAVPGPLAEKDSVAKQYMKDF